MDKNFEDLLMAIKADGEGQAQAEENVAPRLEGEGTDVDTGSGKDATPIVAETGEDDVTGDPADAQGAEGELEGSADPEEDEDEIEAETDDDTLFILEDDEEEVAEATESQFLEKVKDVVGEDISTTEQLKEYVQNLKEEVSTLKSQVSENPLENIPEQLKEAIKYAKDGKADYLELLDITSIDYTKLDPATLAEQDIRQYFYDSQGNFDEDGFIDYVDNVPEKELEIRGRQRINALVLEQQRQKQEFIARQEARVAQENASIIQAVNNLKSIGDFKVKESDKQKLINKMVNGNYKNVFGGDFSNIAKTLFIGENFDRMAAVLKTKTRNAVKADVIANIGNQTIASPVDKNAHNPQGGTDPLDMMIERAKKSSEAQSLNTFYEQNNNK